MLLCIIINYRFHNQENNISDKPTQEKLRSVPSRVPATTSGVWRIDVGVGFITIGSLSCAFICGDREGIRVTRTTSVLASVRIGSNTDVILVVARILASLGRTGCATTRVTWAGRALRRGVKLERLPRAVLIVGVVASQNRQWNIANRICRGVSVVRVVRLHTNVGLSWQWHTSACAGRLACRQCRLGGRLRTADRTSVDRG